MTHASFDGLRVLSLESRRAQEVAKLIRTYGGEPFVVPAMREIPLESNRQAVEFVGGLIEGKFDLVIFLTGVGIRALLEIAQTKYDREEVLRALRSVKVAARGPKPGGVLKELKVPVAATAPEPNTWREMMRALETEFGDRLGEMRVAVQEYGTSNPEFLSELAVRSAEVTRVPVYQWSLPEDTTPLRECVQSIARGSMDVVLFMTGVQVAHLFQIAEQIGQTEELRAGLAKMAVVSIGPSTTEELTRYGVAPDFEPSHPKMGFMVNEAAQFASRILERKRKVDAAKPNSAIKKGAARSRGDASAARLRDGLDFLHEVSSRLAAADSFHVVLGSIVDFVTAVTPCDSCFIYVLEQDKLVLRASKNPHADLVDQLGMELGQGITGWVAEHREPVAIASGASNDPRFVVFRNLPEDHFEAILCTPILCASKVVGVITLQHQMSYQHTPNEIRLLSTLGFLVGAEIERSRLETENAQLAGRLETRKAVDRAKGILQRDLAMGEDEAYRMMQRESRQRRLSMREIADAIVLSDELKKTTARA